MAVEASGDRAVHTAEVDAVVVGAGFSGLYMLHRLRDSVGLTVQVFEAGDGVGGTWYWNRYPGARCDSDGYVYCFSFDEQLLQEWSWSGKYPEQPELLRYLEHVADRFDLRRDIDFTTRVKSAVFDDDVNRWIVTTDRGDRVSARYFIPAIGHLSIAKYVPDLPGLDEFEGEWVHTSNWPAEGAELQGRRVGIIGTGSTGVQAIPVLAEQAGHLTVFQRSPQYSVPARHETVTPEFLRNVKAHYSEIFDACRSSPGGFPWRHNGKSALEVSEDERQAIYEALWAEGGIKFALGSFKDISYDVAANKSVSEFIQRKIAEVIHDPATRESLVPTDHPFLSRRPIIDTHYFETYNRPDVSLIDLRKTPIERVTTRGIQTSEGEVELDLLIFATGFDAVTGPYFNIDIRGAGGLALTQAWRQGPQTYLGLQTVGFPNMLMVTGPTSTAGNLPLSIENHVDWIADCLDYMRDREYERIEPTQDAQEQWMAYVAEQSERSLMRYANSWYNGSNIPGKARAYLFYLGHFGRYRERIREVARRDYDGFVLARGRRSTSVGEG